MNDAVQQLRQNAQEALASLRASGALAEGVLQEAELHALTLDGADFSGADLRRAEFNFASLQEANFTGADLSHASFEMADLRGADLTGAVLDHTNFTAANLQDAVGLEEAQLVQCSKLWRATMPDGTRYDGRYVLPGDIRGTADILTVDFDRPHSVADYYGIPVERYEAGQEWAQQHLNDLLDGADYRQRLP